MQKEIPLGINVNDMQKEIPQICIHPRKQKDKSAPLMCPKDVLSVLNLVQLNNTFF